MSYRKASHMLPAALLQQIQEYVDGEMIYIPRKSENKKEWGTDTLVRQEMKVRNREIYEAFCAGQKTGELSERFYLSVKSIQRIIREQRMM